MFSAILRPEDKQCSNRYVPRQIHIIGKHQPSLSLYSTRSILSKGFWEDCLASCLSPPLDPVSMFLMTFPNMKRLTLSYSSQSFFFERIILFSFIGFLYGRREFFYVQDKTTTRSFVIGDNNFFHMYLEGDTKEKRCLYSWNEQRSPR